MVRIVTATIVLLTLIASAVSAEERPSSDPVAPSAAVAAAWKAEAPAPSTTLRALIASYAVAQGLDMTTTIIARSRGAAEANPLMQGGYAQGIAMKAALATASVFAVRQMDKTHRKAAIATMIAANVVTVAIAAHNLHVSNHLSR